MANYGHLIKDRLLFSALENILCIISIILLSLYINKGTDIWWPFILIAPSGAIFVNFFMVNYDSTPVNGTYFVTLKMILLMRLLLLYSIVLKIEGVASWKWATTLWPFWCSLAVQSIVNMAVLVIAVQNLLSWIYHPCDELNQMLGSLWTFILCIGFSFSVMQSCFVAVCIMDYKNLHNFKFQVNILPKSFEKNLLDVMKNIQHGKTLIEI